MTSDVLRFHVVHPDGARSDHEGPRLVGVHDQRSTVVDRAMGYRRPFSPRALDRRGSVQHFGLAGILRCRPISWPATIPRGRWRSSAVAPVVGPLHHTFAVFFRGATRAYVRGDCMAE